MFAFEETDSEYYTPSESSDVSQETLEMLESFESFESLERLNLIFTEFFCSTSPDGTVWLLPRIYATLHLWRRMVLRLLRP